MEGGEWRERGGKGSAVCVCVCVYVCVCAEGQLVTQRAAHSLINLKGAWRRYIYHLKESLCTVSRCIPWCSVSVCVCMCVCVCVCVCVQRIKTVQPISDAGGCSGAQLTTCTNILKK